MNFINFLVTPPRSLAMSMNECGPNYAILFLMMLACELMKTHVVKGDLDMTLAEALDLMDLYQTSGLPVVDAGGRLCGIVTESDIARFLERDQIDLTRMRSASQLPVSTCMTTDVLAVDEMADLERVTRLLFSNGVKRTPVLNDQRQIIGMIHRIDILQALIDRDAEH